MWVIERGNGSHLTLKEASKKFNRIAAWEVGDASPTYPQLERLADKLKLPVAVFFFSSSPGSPRRIASQW